MKLLLEKQQGEEFVHPAVFIFSHKLLFWVSCDIIIGNCKKILNISIFIGSRTYFYVLLYKGDFPENSGGFYYDGATKKLVQTRKCAFR